MATIRQTLAELGLHTDRVAIIIVDHGSRRDESNAMLGDVVELFRRVTGHSLVEPAHMELAEPSIQTAFDRAAKQGASLVVVMPYFLLPGRHWYLDIPSLSALAATRHPQLQYLVAAPIGLHELMAQVMTDRITHCLRHTIGEDAECDLCAGTDRCQLYSHHSV